jgi:threonine dehydrogenase-like Zn-dependent dehydrogenase
MKALVVEGPGVVGLAEIDDPVAGVGDVVVTPVLSGLCGTDLEIVAGTIDAAYVHYPVALGHEWVGQIDGGPLVVVEGIIPCTTCDECQRGATNRCRTYDEIGFTRHGAIAEGISVPRFLVHELGADVTALDAVLLEPMAVVWRALRRADVPIGARCLVIGDGTVGLLCALLLQRFAPASVTMLGLRPAQAGLAARAGVTSFVTDLGDERYDYVIEAAGQGPAIAKALSAVARGGTVTLLGLPAHGTAVDLFPDDVVNNDVVIQGSFSYTRAAWAEVVALLNEGLIRPAFLVTHEFSLGQWREALDTLAAAPADQPRGKVVLSAR